MAATIAFVITNSHTVQAQEFPPQKPVTMVVGFAAGGAADLAARLIAKELSETVGQSVVVDNKAGAGGNIAHGQVAKGPKDGSMLLFGSVGPLTISPHLMKVNYDPFKDLAPISGGVYFPNVLVVHKGTGITTFEAFIQRAKEHPNTVEYASSGAGSASHLTGELLSQKAGAPMVHVPYKGGAPALQDLLGERVASYFAAPPTAMPYVETDKLTALATTGLQRPAYLPNVPTVAESGFPGFDALNWYAFVAPAGTPETILEKWNHALVQVLNKPDVKEALQKHGLTPHPTTRQELAEFIRSEDQKWKKVIQDGQLKTQN
nr:tripartite tricarboxylate transporter substrate binding protein [Lampropedia puyangensis]